jgi:hypothetical protein
VCLVWAGITNAPVARHLTRCLSRELIITASIRDYERVGHRFASDRAGVFASTLFQSVEGIPTVRIPWFRAVVEDLAGNVARNR